MRPVYAAQFEVLPPPDFSQDTLPGLVRTEAGDWVSQWYAEHQSLSVSLPFDGGSIEPLSGHRVSVTAATPELGHELWELQWSRSSETHDGLLWTSHCVVAHAGGRTEASVVVHLESTVFRLS